MDGTCTTGRDCPCGCQRWDALYQHRPALLRLARARSVSPADAEDAVAEALLRGYGFDALDLDDPFGWLARVTINLCHDAARERGRAAKRAAYTARLGLIEPSFEDSLCDIDEARTAARHVQSLPASQRTALQLKADGAGVPELAHALGTSYKAAESLLSRGRAAVRAAMAATAGVLAWLLGHTPRLRPSRLTPAAAVPAALAFAVTIGAPQTPAATPPAPASPGPSPGTPNAPSNRQQDQAANMKTQPGPPAPIEAADTSPATGTRAGFSRPPATVDAGPVGVTDGGSTYSQEEPLEQSLMRCLRERPTVTPSMIGCPPRRVAGSG